jgi:hypothetical protein
MDPDWRESDPDHRLETAAENLPDFGRARAFSTNLSYTGKGEAWSCFGRRGSISYLYAAPSRGLGRSSLFYGAEKRIAISSGFATGRIRNFDSDNQGFPARQDHAWGIWLRSMISITLSMGERDRTGTDYRIEREEFKMKKKLLSLLVAMLFTAGTFALPFGASAQGTSGQTLQEGQGQKSKAKKSKKQQKPKKPSSGQKKKSKNKKTQDQQA